MALRKPKAPDTYETNVTLTGTLFGQEVTVEDVEVTVTYEYEPGERAIMYGDSACPGSDPLVTISSVTVNGTDEDVTDSCDLDALAETIREFIGDDEVNAKEDAAERRAEERRDRARMGDY